jgi:hypothetical protein
MLRRHGFDAVLRRLCLESTSISAQKLDSPIDATSVFIGGSAHFSLLTTRVLGSQILNHFLLLAIDPAGKDHDEQLPRLKNKFHRRLGQAKPRRSLEFTDKSSKHGRNSAQIAPILYEINDEATFSAADAHMTSAQMRTRGVPGTPFFTVSERRRTYLTPRDAANPLDTRPNPCEPLRGFSERNETMGARESGHHPDIKESHRLQRTRHKQRVAPKCK